MSVPGFAALALLARSRRMVMGGRHPMQDMMQGSPPLG